MIKKELKNFVIHYVKNGDEVLILEPAHRLKRYIIIKAGEMMKQAHTEPAERTHAILFNYDLAMGFIEKLEKAKTLKDVRSITSESEGLESLEFLGVKIKINYC